MQGFLGAVGVLAAIIVFVVAHEAGHFFAAKATGMKVTEFFLGFGPRIWSFRRGDTEYGIKPLPFGAYVRIVGMSALEEVEPADVGRTYREKEFWKKAVVVLAGVAANFIVAYFLFFGLVVSTGEQVPTTTVAGLVEGRTAASDAGLRPGDTIVAIDGSPVSGWEDLATQIADMPGKAITLGVVRDGSSIEVAVTLGTRTSGDETLGYLGVGPTFDRLPISWFTALGIAGREVGSQIAGTLGALGQIFRLDTLGNLVGGITGGAVNNETRPVSPIGLAQIGAQASTLGLGNLIFLLAAVNVTLGTVNALPLFPLDGGHFAVALFEKLTRKKVDVRALIPVAVLVIGALGVIGVMSIILDITHPIQLPS
jgi:membrane-associated protease RseP (regulator of RpoE activity)